MTDHVEIPVKLAAWLRVEDGNVTGIDLSLDTVELAHDDFGRCAFAYPRGGDDPDNLTSGQADAVFAALPSRREWKITRVENSDGAVYLDETA